MAALGGQSGGTVGRAGGAAKTETTILSTLRADRPLWLLKIHKFVAQHWFGQAPQAGAGAGAGAVGGAGAAALGNRASASAPTAAGAADEREPIGKVRMEFDPITGISQFTVHLSTNGLEPGQGQKGQQGGQGDADAGLCQFPLDFMQNHIPMHVFSEAQAAGAQGGGVSLEGRVEYKFDMVPPLQDALYSRLVKERSTLANTPLRTTMAAESGPMKKMLLQSLKRKAPVSFAQSAAQRQALALENKRVRTTKEKLEARLFKLFEDQTSWTLKQLGDATQQPQQFLKEVLTDLCIYHKKGQLQGQYELKPEYKQQKDETNEKDEDEGNDHDMDNTDALAQDLL